MWQVHKISLKCLPLENTLGWTRRNEWMRREQKHRAFVLDGWWFYFVPNNSHVGAWVHFEKIPFKNIFPTKCHQPQTFNSLYSHMPTYQGPDNVYKCTHLSKTGRATESSGRMRQVTVTANTMHQVSLLSWLSSIYTTQRSSRLTCLDHNAKSLLPVFFIRYLS